MTANDPAHNKIVLVPTDFSDECRNAIYHAVKLARRSGFRVCILHVITKETRSMLRKMQVGAEYVDWKLNEYRKYYEKKYGVKVETMSVQGNIFTTINEVAAKTGAIAIVLGTHGRKGLQHVFGSYALRVVLESPVPVIVVQKVSYRDHYRNIVFPLPDNIEPVQSIRWAKMIAGMFGSKFYFLPWQAKEAGFKDRLAILTGQVRSIFDREPLPDIVIPSNTSTDFAEEVLAFTLAVNADMIMLVNHPESSGFGISTLDEKLMFNEEQIPVICINPGLVKRI